MRLAGAPISWGVCEVPGWGVQVSPERMLDDAMRLDLRDIEAGPPGFLPADAREAPTEANDPARDVARSRDFALAHG